MTGLLKPTLVAAMTMVGAGSSYAQDAPKNNGEIRDLKATILDLKGPPSDLNSAISDLSARADGLAAQYSGLSVRQDKQTVRVSMTGDILFDFDKASIRPAAETTLSDIARLIRSISAGTVVIEGHTDSKGTVRYNKDLSLRRAKAVAKWLAAHGADKARLSVKALGDSRPIAPNTLENGADNPKGRALNRRVEFVLPRESQ
ncbi:OmpA family protein [Pseudaminobacter soli (ex Li et al. 2025)]|uniref:OmpA family protein n=1 Tax=Pseudaminobacter soli (ex Li et al. 2025) TaxID=1295366 RepID=A0A2P7RVY6_9HYPH|nr:OmpA family protein [Mesorhizobium soli]PSJ54366.1 OmpA family protein [Mesorhizobium soli]